jgi:TM2 domain-containing membrane protein YozV
MKPHNSQSLTIHDLTEKELLILQQEFDKRKKNEVIAWLLWAFLGLFGAHRFYLGRIGTGLIMLFTLGGFVIWAIIDIFLIPGMLRDYHKKLNDEIIQEIVAIRRGGQTMMSQPTRQTTSGGIKCLNCGSTNSQGTLVCTFCGSKIINNHAQQFTSFVCPYCRNNINYGVNPCPFCRNWLQW